MRRSSLLVIAAMFAPSCVNHRPAQSLPSPNLRQHTTIVHDFQNGLDGIRTSNPAVKLSIGQDGSLEHQAVLLVEYPAPTSDPAARDVHLDAATINWSTGRALSFQVKPAAPIRLSVSFVDRNGVVYTSWTNLQAATWQTVRIEFAAIRPNPYFQPPTAKIGAPLDVTEVKGLAFAPQDPRAGRLALARIVLVE